jgi:hypothetical protein
MAQALYDLVDDLFDRVAVGAAVFKVVQPASARGGTKDVLRFRSGVVLFAVEDIGSHASNLTSKTGDTKNAQP